MYVKFLFNFLINNFINRFNIDLISVKTIYIISYLVI